MHRHHCLQYTVTSNHKYFHVSVVIIYFWVQPIIPFFIRIGHLYSTHCGLIAPYGVIDLCQYSFQQWHIAWRHKAIDCKSWLIANQAIRDTFPWYFIQNCQKNDNLRKCITKHRMPNGGYLVQSSMWSSRYRVSSPTSELRPNQKSCRATFPLIVTQMIGIFYLIIAMAGLMMMPYIIDTSLLSQLHAKACFSLYRIWYFWSECQHYVYLYIIWFRANITETYLREISFTLSMVFRAEHSNIQ